MVKYRPDGTDQFADPHFRSTCQRQMNLNAFNKQYRECVDKVREPDPHFRSTCQRPINLNAFNEQYRECVDKVRESFQSYQRAGSGWHLKELKVTFYDKSLGSSDENRQIHNTFVMNIKYTKLMSSLGILGIFVFFF